tara:strand:+ start:57 stop:161 length:105 start_codon:yes stop_codon:yes gene_type:complete
MKMGINSKQFQTLSTMKIMDKDKTLGEMGQLIVK